MKKIMLLFGFITILLGCSQEDTVKSEDIQIASLDLKNRAPSFPEPELLGEFNSGCVANIIFLAEGFQESEMTEFKTLCYIAKQAILDMQPFANTEDRFNFYRVDSPSNVSGISTREFESNCNGTTGTDNHLDTAWAVYSNRVGMAHYVGMKPAARHYIEDLYGSYATGDYAYTIIIANTTAYRGGAEFPGVTEHNDIANPRVSNMIVSKYDSGAYFKFLVRHEFGHSFGNLDDEYVDALSNCAINGYEPWYLPPTPKLNLRTYNPGGWFEGGRYVPTGYFRQWDVSIMSTDYFTTTFAPVQASVVKRRIAVATQCN